MSDEIVAATTTETTPAASSEAVVVSGTETQAQATPPAGEAAQAAQTLATADPVEKPVAVTATWPDDWRVKLAGEDKAYLKTLERYASPADLAKAHRELQARMSRGELKAGLKPDATPEEVATWRKENGIPAAPEEYKPELPNGMVLGEADKPMVEWFQKTAHEVGLPPSQFNAILGGFYQMQDQARQAAYDKAQEFRQMSDDALRAEWGNEYRANIRGITNALSPFFQPEVLDRVFNAESANGDIRYQMGNDPDFLRGLNLLARSLNPMATLVPAGSADPMKAGEARITEIETMIRNRDDAYWKNPALQQEYAQLLGARDQMKGRAA